MWWREGLTRKRFEMPVSHPPFFEAHLVDRVLPDVPVRQWVLSVPHALRYRLAYDATLVGQVAFLRLRG